MKRFAAVIAMVFALILAGPLADAAGLAKGISINKWSIKSITPAGLTSVKGTVAVNVTNSGKKPVVITGISGVVYTRDGKVFITGTADDVVIPKGTVDLEISGQGKLGSLSALGSLLSSGFSLKPADYSVDIIATVKVGRKKEQLVELKKTPLSSILKK